MEIHYYNEMEKRKRDPLLSQDYSIYRTTQEREEMRDIRNIIIFDTYFASKRGILKIVRWGYLVKIVVNFPKFKNNFFKQTLIPNYTKILGIWKC